MRAMVCSLVVLLLAGCQCDPRPAPSAAPESDSGAETETGLGVGLSSGGITIQLAPGIGINPATGGVEPSIGF